MSESKELVRGRVEKESVSNELHRKFITVSFYQTLTNLIMIAYIGWCKKMAQLLVGRNLKTTQQNSTKVQTTISQHVFNHIVNFQCKWTTNVEMTVA